MVNTPLLYNIMKYLKNNPLNKVWKNRYNNLMCVDSDSDLDLWIVCMLGAHTIYNRLEDSLPKTIFK